MTLEVSIWWSVLSYIRRALSKFSFVTENLQISFKYIKIILKNYFQKIIFG